MGRAGLNLDVVVHAALRIADTEGIEKVGMRRVSRALGVTPMALYRYLPDKESLVDVVADESLRAVPAPDPSAPMHAELLRCFGSLYELLVDHPGLARAVGEHPLEGPVAMHLGEMVLALLERNGIGEREAAHFLVSAFSLTLGCALYRTSRGGLHESSRLPHAGTQVPTVNRLRWRLSAASDDDGVFREAFERLAAGYMPTP
ncbi:TetR family transcriptional regulator [Mycobacteroides abscessus subsp. abscessus]|uniref:TetR/AcrR family transcriptional regulator n=1 Tax=Mycobacteroides abscessus TaxID=36809 RepID=UPI00092A2818|nr:TetR/AcrR family transcriptional regulator [Mycobacteroides abscessus]SHU54874.1 TetR family transcriptional regulator [Mycobacteroides abscessus subsp. abscessus]SHX64806.1 TetR family transcriptional regulator [Mycobacteroides abscessus subsp. abscessus]SIG93346.1 TetR family transcriptional regulator [Mycobacteroides abscessus subsp. abscessus]SKD19047.1 TetR family transcriptional regulator [Mycobacteroides abscessus subsp. abscessus]SKM54903.1 TetR family transcriptional regulator [Myc